MNTDIEIVTDSETINSELLEEEEEQDRLDVTFKEDHSRIRLGHGPENITLLRRLCVNLMLNQEGITVVTSLHQVQMVRQYFPRAIALRDGRVMFDGAVEKLNDNRLTSIYGSAVEELVLRGHGEVLV